ncbi:MAG: LLM class F420-dependent oxidoreductase [Chloroflexi bacterium]|nr:LLM class F420-dependent oxidoreductase [Chloroflexota bacterium]
MQFGCSMFITDHTIAPDELARAVEERGFDSLWMPEHPHIPSERVTPFPGTNSIDMPEWYFRSYDPFVCLSMAAAATTTLKVGTAICLVIEREPIVMAKQVASIDRLSGGRFLFGVGAGWLAEEMEALGTPFKQRWAVARERVEAMKALWANEEAEYHGEHVTIERTSVRPAPVQQPHPPIYIGAGTKWSRQRVVEWADGWLPLFKAPQELAAEIADLRERAERIGRDPGSVSVTLYGTRPDAAWLDAYEEMGVDRCLFDLPSAYADKVIPILDDLAKLVADR